MGNIEKMCKKAMKGEKPKEDLFIESLSFSAEEKRYRKELVRYGKTLVPLREQYVKAEQKLFI